MRAAKLRLYGYVAAGVIIFGVLALPVAGCEEVGDCVHCTGGTGGSGGSGGNSSTSTMSTSMMATGPSGTENNCLDGADDDNDGDTDCEDSDCRPDYECVPGVNGAKYVIISESSEACDSGTPKLLQDCATCACEPVPGRCEIDGAIGGSDDTNCSGAGTVVFATSVDLAECDVLEITDSNGIHVKISSSDPVNPSLASCTATNFELTVCEINAGTGSCANPTDVCIPKNDPVCVLVDGDCPGEYPEPRNIQEGGSCGCTCEVDVEQCPVAATFYSQPECAGVPALKFEEDMPGACLLFNTLISVASVRAPESQVTCNEPIPNPDGSPEKTLCCKQPIVGEQLGRVKILPP